MAQKHAPQIVGNMGLFYTCYQLSLLGWNAMPTSRNARGVDVICFSMDGRKMVTVQVKSLSKKNQPVPLGKSLDTMMGDFWVVVTNAASGQPECYVLLPHEIRAMAQKREKDGNVSYWLQPKQYAVEAFHEKWERMGHG
jgi:hypothetical protein